LMVSADSGSLLMVFPQFPCHPEGEARGTFADQ
jgi:hypothetical protein